MTVASQTTVQRRQKTKAAHCFCRPEANLVGGIVGVEITIERVSSEFTDLNLRALDYEGKKTRGFVERVD